MNRWECLANSQPTFSPRRSAAPPTGGSVNLSLVITGDPGTICPEHQNLTRHESGCGEEQGSFFFCGVCCDQRSVSLLCIMWKTVLIMQHLLLRLISGICYQLIDPPQTPVRNSCWLTVQTWNAYQHLRVGDQDKWLPELCFMYVFMYLFYYYLYYSGFFLRFVIFYCTFSVYYINSVK